MCFDSFSSVVVMKAAFTFQISERFAKSIEKAADGHMKGEYTAKPERLTKGHSLVGEVKCVFLSQFTAGFQ